VLTMHDLDVEIWQRRRHPASEDISDLADPVQ